MGVINKIIKFFKNVQKKFGYLGKGLGGFGGGMLSSLIAVFQAIGIVGKSVVFNTGTMFEVIWMYIECTGEFLFKLPQCFVLHILMAIFTVTYYLFFQLPVMLIELALGLSLKNEVDMLWNIIRTGDDVIYGIAGFYLTQFPPSMMKKCYSCRGKKFTSKEVDKGQKKMERAGQNIKRDTNVKAARVFRKPKDKMNDGMKKMKKVFS